MRSNVVNLSDGYSERVGFIAAHTAVIYDKRLQKQTFMQVNYSCMHAHVAMRHAMYECALATIPIRYR